MIKKQQIIDGPRDHLFISYAWEDQEFAKWLALRLTAEGYKVWIDQFKLLGGESWPLDIDKAIKTRTFRVLALLSRHSIAKPNPLKERTLALNLSKQPGMKGFMIPINVDGMPATELDWLSSDITFVPFQSSWAKGFGQLIKLLNREVCPKSDANGRAIAARLARTSQLIASKPEDVTSNACKFIQIPDEVTTYIISPKLDSMARSDALRDWSFYEISPYRVVAFHPPDDDLASWLHVDAVKTHAWRSVDTIEGVDSRNIIVRLLRGCIETRLRFLGFEWSSAAKAYAIPGNHGKALPVILPNGKATTVKHSGQRTYYRIGQPKTQYRYRIAVNITIERDLLSEFTAVWRLRFHLTDQDDSPLPENTRLSRRKHLTRGYFNRHWLIRHLAVIQLCADDAELIRVGPDGISQVIIDCRPFSFSMDKSIDESKIDDEKEIHDDIPVIEDEFIIPLDKSETNNG